MFGSRTKDIIISYKNLRRLIGVLGLSIPFLCLIGLFITRTELQPSISHCYHTNVRDVFVGIMIGVSMFLITYNGYDFLDDIITSVTGPAGIGLALCPCLERGGSQVPVGYFNLNPNASDTIHLTCASLFFVLLAINSIFLFTKTKDKMNMTSNKKRRNFIYVTCGIIMLTLMLLLVILKIILREKLDDYPLLFFIESLMLFSFGISWLIKGETIFKDKAAIVDMNP